MAAIVPAPFIEIIKIARAINWISNDNIKCDHEHELIIFFTVVYFHLPNKYHFNVPTQRHCQNRP